MTGRLRRLVFPVALFLFLLSAPALPANASLIGDSATCGATGNADLSCDPTAATVAAGSPEFDLSVAGSFVPLTVNIEASTISLITGLCVGCSNTFPAGVLTLGDLDSSAGDIVGVALVEIAGKQLPKNLDAADITFTAHSVIVDLAGTSWVNSPIIDDNVSGALLVLTFDASAVPAPATLLLLVSAVGGLSAVRASRRR